jgi:hypothetical protein
LWDPGLIWTYALSDAGIALAYFSIPVALIVIARQRRDLVFRPLLWLFAAFILLCGTTHWLDVLTLWVPAYGLEATVKGAIVAVSLFTAFTTHNLRRSRGCQECKGAKDRVISRCCARRE